MQERGNGVSDEIFTRPAALLWLYDPRHADDPPGLGDDVACPVSRVVFGSVCSVISCAKTLGKCNILRFHDVHGTMRNGSEAPGNHQEIGHCKHIFSAAKSRIARHGSWLPPELSSEPPRNGPTQDVIFIIPSFRDVPCEDIHRAGLGGAGPGIGLIDT